MEVSDLKNEIFIIPTNDSPIKIVIEGCNVCKEIKKELVKRKTNPYILEVYDCKNCGGSFCV